MPLSRNVLLLLIFCACHGKSTQQLLDGDALTDSKTSIKLTVPANGATITAESNLIFGWQEKENINKYQVEISNQSDFSNIIVSKVVEATEYVYNPADLKPGVTLESSGLYWRVRVPYVKSNLQSEPFVANYLVGGVYYVDCAYTGAASAGTKAAPLKSIQGGLDAALVARQGLPTATGEVRVAKGTCNESIVLRGNVALKGGYDSSQNWVRNPRLHQTTITTTNAHAVQGQVDLVATFSNSLVEGFRITTTNTGTNTFHSVSLTGATVTFRNNFITNTSVTSGAGNGVGTILATNGGTLTLDSNIFMAVSSATSNYVTNVLFNSSSVTATNNIFYVSVARGAAILGMIVTGNSGTMVVNTTNNTFFMAASTVTVNDVSPTGFAVDSGGAFSGNFDRNLIFHFTSANTNRCGQQTNGGAYFTNMRNNALVDCSGGVQGIWVTVTGGLNASYASPWTAAVSAGGVGAALDTVSGQGLSTNTASQHPTNCSGVCAALSGNRGGSTVPGTPTRPGDPNVIFQGYVANDPTTFTFKPNAIADMNNDGQYTASIDAGANTATAGLLNVTTN